VFLSKHTTLIPCAHVQCSYQSTPLLYHVHMFSVLWGIQLFMELNTWIDIFIFNMRDKNQPCEFSKIVLPIWKIMPKLVKLQQGPMNTTWNKIQRWQLTPCFRIVGYFLSFVDVCAKSIVKLNTHTRIVIGPIN